MPGLVIILFCEEKKLPKEKLCVDCLRTMCCCANRRASNLPQNFGAEAYRYCEDLPRSLQREIGFDGLGYLGILV